MTERLRRLWVAPAVLLIVGLSVSPVAAADKTKVDAATKQVQDGAKQIGQGAAGSGFKDLFKGIGNTIVEGAKFSGNTIAEAFKK
jgi:hypothetical protein